MDYLWACLLVVCIWTRPAGSSKYSRTRKDTLGYYYTRKRLMRYIYLIAPTRFVLTSLKLIWKKCQLAITNFCHFLWNKSSPSERYSLFETLLIWRYMSLNHTRSATFSYNMKLHWAYLAISPNIIITIIIMMITMVYLTDSRDGSSLFNYSICNYR